MNYLSSPVGPYLESALVGFGPGGPTVVEMTVTAAQSREAGREFWGFPKELADLAWNQNRRHVEFREADRHWRFWLQGPSLPFRVTGWTKQRRAGQTVVVPVRAAGRVALAFNGRRWALWLDPLRLSVFPARSSS